MTVMNLMVTLNLCPKSNQIQMRLKGLVFYLQFNLKFDVKQLKLHVKQLKLHNLIFTVVPVMKPLTLTMG